MNAIIEVKRADGTTEMVESSYHHIYYPQWPRIQDEYKAAGIEAISYKNPDPVVVAKPTAKPMTSRQFYARVHAEEHRENGRCPKCGTWCYGDCTATH